MNNKQVFTKKQIDAQHRKADKAYERFEKAHDRAVELQSIAFQEGALYRSMRHNEEQEQQWQSESQRKPITKK